MAPSEKPFDAWSPQLLVLLFIVTVLLFKLLSKKDHPRRLPPGPRKLPIIGNLHQISQPLPLCLQRLAEQHGPLIMLQLGTVRALVISSAEVLRDVIKQHDLVFSGKPASYVPKKLSYDFHDIFFAPYGEYWRQVRKISILELLSPKRVKSFHSVRMEEVANVCEVIASSRGPVNISELMASLANSVICREAFGRKDFDEEYKFYELLNEVQEVLGTVNISDFFPWLGWTIKINGFEKKVEKVFKVLDRFYDELIEEHRDRSRIGADSSHMDFVDVLVAVQGDDKQAIKLTVDQIKGIIMNILIGGTDPSSSILVWTMTELMKSPASMKALKDELTKAANGKEMIEETDFPQLEYLRMVLKESFRLHPPLQLLLRETIQDCKIMGYEIPANTSVFLNARAIGRDPNTWEDPLIFRPERFLNSSIDFRGKDLELIPFGVGRRGCPGINMALPLVELALANLVHHFDWNMPPGMSPDDIDMEDSLGVATQKKTPLILVASPRTPLRT
ncbi:hypothetical protein Droror1_Dr00021360 [Drosera rotundifolia]